MVIKMKRKQTWFYIGVGVVLLLLIYMIGVGANGKALAARQKVFTFHKGEVLPKKATYYVKGITNPKKVEMDMSQVNTDKTGNYILHIKQSSHTYDVKIQIIAWENTDKG